VLDFGEWIDVWIVEKPLGVGGTASVYRCHNADAERIIGAVKVLDDLALHRGDSHARFIREAEVLFGLDHPGIVKIRNVRADHDPPYLVMEYVDGRPLSQLILSGALPLERALDILQELAEALAYLHGRGVRHRDIKPANILIRDDVVDFGLVLEAGRTRLTAEGIRMGTVSYVPPEWATPSNINPVAWDVYALGTVTWEMLTGQGAFPSHLPVGQDGHVALQILADKQDHKPLDPGPSYRPEFRDLIRRMTHADPMERPEAAEIAAIAATLGRSENPMPAGDSDGMKTLDGFADLATGEQGALPTLGLERIDSLPEPAVPVVEGTDTSGFSTGPGCEVVGCEAPCRCGSEVLHVVAGDGPWTTTLSVEAPTIATPEPEPKTEPESEPEPEPSLSADADPGVAAFADAATAAGKVGAGYFSGWEGAVSPGPGAMSHMTWYAGAAYCESRGGLLAKDDPPTRWQGQYMEWRQDGGKAAWRSRDDRSSGAANPLDASPNIGVRCKR